MNKTVIKNVAFFVAGIGVGYGAGYLLTKKKFEAYADEEIASIKEAYATSRQMADKEGIFSTPESAAKALIPEEEFDLSDEALFEKPEVLSPEEDAAFNGTTESDGLSDDEREIQEKVNRYNSGVADELKNYGSTTIPESVRDSRNVFDEGFQIVVDPNGPYIIDIDSFMDDENGYAKISLSYWEGDGVVTDEVDSVVPHAEVILGLTYLESWGLGSTDKNAVYVRNDREKKDYEVIKDEKSFSVHVLGVDPEVNSKGNPRKMRDEDE